MINITFSSYIGIENWHWLLTLNFVDKFNHEE